MIDIRVISAAHVGGPVLGMEVEILTTSDWEELVVKKERWLKGYGQLL